MQSIKEVARLFGCSYEAVRQQVKRYSVELDGHIFKNNRTQLLDDDAVAFLRKHREESPVVIENIETNALIEKLRAELYEKEQAINKEKDRIIDLTTQLAEAQKLALQGENAILRLEAETDKAEQLKSQNETLEKQLEQVRAELETEQNRKLSFAERLRGKKKRNREE
jgi:hypothetical protein